MKKIFREIFSDESGHLSSNRVLGAIGWVVGLVLACIGKTAEATVVMGVAGAKLGVGQIKSAVVKSSQTTPTAAHVEASNTPTAAHPTTQQPNNPTHSTQHPTSTQKEKGDL